MNIQRIVATLKELGFTEYEAKVYIALLKNHPANGNVISVASGVPGPKTYETLRKMQEKGIVFAVSGGDKPGTKRYSPLPYRDLLLSIEKTLAENISMLRESFDSIESGGDIDWTGLFLIQGYEPAVDAARTAIDEAQSEVLMSCWAKELALLYDNLLAAHKRGISVTTLVFDQCPKEIPWRNFDHTDTPMAMERHEGELSLAVDMNKTIVLQSLNEQPHAVVSSHRAMVQTTRNYIRHDIYVNRLLRDFKEIIVMRYGPGLEKLISDF